jgi:hypothetical protein
MREAGRRIHERRMVFLGALAALVLTAGILVVCAFCVLDPGVVAALAGQLPGEIAGRVITSPDLLAPEIHPAL